MEISAEKDNVVMTGGSFTTSEDTASIVTSQPKTMSKSESESRMRGTIGQIPFDDAHCERDWSSGICACHKDDKRHCCCSFCCWPYFKYMVATRLGETPFMALIPCATFALRVKVRTSFGIKGSLVDDFFATLCCEPCTVCQMTRELDKIGL